MLGSGAEGTTVHTLPPIEAWWPGLPIHLKQQILRDLDAPLSREVLDEVFGESAPSDHINGASGGYDIIRLNPEERAFVRTQSEPVD